MPQLDGLRALAILAVLYTHFFPEDYWLLGIYWGGSGVRLFFVLSGFLITRILLREGSEAGGRPGEAAFLIRRFYVRRYLRLTPVFYATLAVMVALNVPNARSTVWWHVFYLSNFKFAIMDDWQGAVAHFWTLSVEEQFYLLWPPAVIFIPVRLLAGLAAALIPGSIAYRYCAHRMGLGDVALWVLPPNSMDALLLGAVTAIGAGKWALNSSQTWTRCAALGGLIIGTVGSYTNIFGPLMEASIPTAFAVSWAWVVLCASEGNAGIPGRLLEHPLLVYLGKTSYGTYVVHMLVWHLVAFVWAPALSLSKEDPRVIIGLALAAISLSIGLASISWRLLETPINHYRHSLDYRRGTSS